MLAIVLLSSLSLPAQVLNIAEAVKKTFVGLTLANAVLTLQVSDNGQGRSPDSWSHGLGLGGVRKRVRQLNGEVRWRELSPEGICCEVVVPCFVGAVQRSH